MTDSPKEYIEARLESPREHADAICDFIIQNIANGIVLEDEEDSPVVGIQFYVSDDKSGTYKQLLSEYVSTIFTKTGIPVPDITEKKIKNVEWIAEYKASIKPLRIANDIAVRPQWHDPLPDAKFDIVIEPRMAFGTGSHETTRSVMLAVREKFQPGMRFLDLGTGSGILSILSAKMGASYIKAIDYDLVAVQNSKENFIINSVEVPHDILFGSIEKCQGDKPYDFVCANIIKSTILPMLPRLVELTAPSGLLVLSGLLEQDADEISAALNGLGQTDFSILTDNKWLTYTVKKQ
jgi:ribosomal protein L11 methyltransferase